LLGSYLILWVRETGEADFKRILTERREGVAIISGTQDDFEISYGATIPGGREKMWSSETHWKRL
jgi:hypothetical protein